MPRSRSIVVQPAPRADSATAAPHHPRLRRNLLDQPTRRGYTPPKANPMRYRVLLQRSDEGIAVSVPGLPGCWSQGQTEEEALANVADAIREYLALVNEQLASGEVREVEVTG